MHFCFQPAFTNSTRGKLIVPARVKTLGQLLRYLVATGATLHLNIQVAIRTHRRTTLRFLLIDGRLSLETPTEKDFHSLYNITPMEACEGFDSVRIELLTPASR
jgi:hypothetical protein